MSLALQSVLVGLAVVTCAIYSAWRLATLRLRMRLIDRLGALPPILTAPWLAALRQRTLSQLAGGCGGCAAGGGLTPDAAGHPNQTTAAPRR